ncbi:hypothetical protein [Rhizobium sp. MHM7A]|uniref:hypothetical protein n=1 Tax=Rhizobium sp. MHM7A TaxID=2583233 RepID=UPI0011073C7B|nr:hypothetical protein [Rhizobium sp. MHM7A]TLX16026.1 hypothetical protein FFR93_01525 [Rhizobium sp. MHM7A]
MQLSSGFRIPKHLQNANLKALVGAAPPVSPFFSIDGRSEYFTRVFEWDDFTAPIWIDQEEGYSIEGLIGYDPVCVGLRIAGNVVGFYLDGGSWIDVEHRGKGLSSKMIICAIAFAGKLPRSQEKGFSEAGFAAHAAAARLLPNVRDDLYDHAAVIENGLGTSLRSIAM